MQVTVEIPDDVARILAPQGQDPARATLEAVAIEGYRSGALTAYQVRRLLGFETRYELDGFLKTHNVWEPTTWRISNRIAKPSSSSNPRAD
jgi:hypothetical protein